MKKKWCGKGTVTESLCWRFSSETGNHSHADAGNVKRRWIQIAPLKSIAQVFAGQRTRRRKKKLNKDIYKWRTATTAEMDWDILRESLQIECCLGVPFFPQLNLMAICRYLRPFSTLPLTVSLNLKRHRVLGCLFFHVFYWAPKLLARMRRYRGLRGCL